MTTPVSVFDFEALARAAMEPGAWDYMDGGAADEITLRANRAAFDKLFLRPRYLVDVSQRDLSTTVLGEHIPFPLLIAPTAYQRLAHPEGEVATARGAGVLGVPMVVSTVATSTLEEVATAASAPLWYQLYCDEDPAVNEWLIRRAERSGCRALVVTIDLPVLGKRERDHRNAFDLPEGMIIRNLFASDLADQPEDFSGATYSDLRFDASLTWDDIDGMRKLTSLPIVIKGILTAEDAELAVRHGAQAVIVSNHGGRQLDGAVPSLDALPEVVAAAGDRIEVYLDSGIRRGTDIVKAIALGARAVFLGRPVWWGLAAQGDVGVTRVLEILRDEFDTAMALLGKTAVSQIDASVIFHPRRE